MKKNPKSKRSAKTAKAGPRAQTNGAKIPVVVFGGIAVVTSESKLLGDLEEFRKIYPFYPS